MAIAYSEDLRKRAVGLVEKGRKIEVVAKLLNIGRTSLYRWVKQKQEKGSLASKKEWQKGYGNKIPDLEKLKEFVQVNKGMTAVAMADFWQVSIKTMCKWLKRIGFTRKKNPMAMSSGMKKVVSYTWK